jgi:hypothetical protein
MSSQFNQSGQVTQPPAICRRPLPPGPYRFLWPPRQAELYCSWIGPPGWSDPERYDFVAEMIYDESLTRYYLQTNPAAPNLTLEVNLYPALDWDIYAAIFVYFDPTHYAEARTLTLPTIRDADITLALPPWQTETPGHTFRLDFSAIYETVTG